MLSTPSASARRHASRSSVIVHCCGWIVTPTLKRLLSRSVAPCPSVMANDLIPHEVDLNSAGDDFWRRYHVFRRARHDEVRTEDPFFPDDLERGRLISYQKFEVNDAVEVVHDGEMVSWLRSAVTRPGAPGYDSNRYFLWCELSVLAPFRRRGIGRSHVPLLLELMDRDGCHTLSMDSEEDSGHAFLRWLGAEKKSEGAENRLH